MERRIIELHLVADAPRVEWELRHIESVKFIVEPQVPNSPRPVELRRRVEVVLDILSGRHVYFTIGLDGVRVDVEVYERDGVRCLRSKGGDPLRPDSLLSLATF